MGVRNLANFTVNNRADEAEKLVRRVKSGLGSTKYKQVDYEKLKAFTAEKKLSGNQTLEKVKQLQQFSKQGKEQHLLKQHHMVWQKEFLRLNSMRRKLQAEVELHVRFNTDSDLANYIYQEFEEFDSKLGGDFNKFKKATVEPVWLLRDDVQFWLSQHKGSLDAEVNQEGEGVLETVESVKAQQLAILKRLSDEQSNLEDELSSGELGNMVANTDKRLPQTGIPTEAFELECPDSSLKLSILQEFILLDEKYVSRLESLESEHASCLSVQSGGWSELDHELFMIIVEQYPHDMQNRRTLYIDRMKRHFPKKTRAQIVEHEEWWMHFRYFNERRRDIIADWVRDRHELLNRCKVVFTEACASHELTEMKEEYKKKQREICDTLYEKVRNWREQKLEAMQLQQELESRRQKRLLEELKKEEVKEKKRRDTEKSKIQEYQATCQLQQKKKEEEDKRRYEELKMELEKQAIHDQERVKFREDQFKHKMTEKAEKEQQKLMDIELREEKLESLRKQVRPHVETDIKRLWSDTKAWEARLKEDEEIVIQRPLFDVTTFTSKQITADPRVRFENRLREAGIVNSDYARKMMANIKPPQQPRRDTESTVFKKP